MMICKDKAILKGVDGGRSWTFFRMIFNALRHGSVVAIFLCCTGLMNPMPAQACHWYELCPGDVTYDAVNTAIKKIREVTTDVGNAAKNSVYGKIISMYSTTTAFFSDTMGSLQDLFSSQLKTKIGTDVLYGEIESKLVNAQIQANATDEVVALAGRTALETGINAGGTDQFLCNVIKTRQGISTMEEFSRMVARVVAVGIDATYVLGEGGPKYWVDDLLLRCGQAEGFVLKSGNPLDGVPAQCHDMVSLPEMSTADRDVNGMALDRSEVYTIPPIKSFDYTKNGVTQKVYKFVPESEDPKIKASMDRWMQASQYCYLVAGYRPPPPRGLGQLTPIGRAKNNKFNECRAQQEVFTMECAYRLGRLTRPNCADPDMKAFCVTAQEACAAAREANLTLDGSYNDCQNGLTYEQIQNVSVQLCGSTRAVQSDVLGGASEASKLFILGRCNKLKNDWQDKIDREDAAFYRALQGLQGIHECFE
ncbi:MAG: hypothetical protein PHD48_08755 [Alphaproteobacteria bacterium]|nr:hypothetical protein [Alphaproteobacteria bacterium]